MTLQDIIIRDMLNNRATLEKERKESLADFEKRLKKRYRNIIIQKICEFISVLVVIGLLVLATFIVF